MHLRFLSLTIQNIFIFLIHKQDLGQHSPYSNYTTDRTIWCWFWAGTKIFLFSETSGLLWGPSSILYGRCLGALSPGVKQLGQEVIAYFHLVLRLKLGGAILLHAFGHKHG